MRIAAPSETESIFFDMDSLPAEYARHGRDGASVSTAAAMGRVSMGDDILDCVLMSGGLDTRIGKLDQGRVSAYRQTEAYLEGRHGQPVVLAETAYVNGSLIRIDGFNGRLATDGKLFGTVRKRPDRLPLSADIRLDSDVCFFGTYMMNDEGYRGYRVDGISQDETRGAFLPINDNVARLGAPKYDRWQNPAGLELRQDIVAGDDIIPWVEEVLEEDIHRYELVIALARFAGQDELEYLAKPPYLMMARKELRLITEEARIITSVARRVTELEDEIRGLVARGEAGLAEIKEEAGPLAFRMPRPARYDQTIIEASSESSETMRHIRRQQTVLSSVVRAAKES